VYKVEPLLFSVIPLSGIVI